MKRTAKTFDHLHAPSPVYGFYLKNRLIFMLQKNIVKNKTNAKYRKWFEFAQKTKNPDNTEEDFQEYMEDEIFREIIKRINKNELSEEDLQYIENETKIREEVERFEGQIYEDGIEKGKKRNAFDVAGKLKAKGFDDEIIAEVTGLSPDEIARL
jgi:predicted transposase/invertase (TIGR01784 family)